MKPTTQVLSKVLLLLLVVAAVLAKERSRLSLGADGGYTDLVVAINRSSPEEPGLVEKIKKMIREFSDQLSTATEPMFDNGASLRLRHVFILVPRSWTNRTEVNATSTWQTYDNADIRLGTSPDASHYTYHAGNCSRIGDYVLFDTDHVRKSDAYWLGKQAVSEFGRYRWGLRSEHNGEKGPHYYLRGKKIYPAVCTTGIKGSFKHNESGRSCQFDDVTLEPEPHCRFYPDLDQAVEASLLTTTLARNIKHFCNVWHSGPEEFRHNKFAPVPLNHISCGAHSGARDLMRKGESGDFRRKPAFDPMPPAVQFTVVRPLPYRRLVIVIDVSGSMFGNPINKIKAGLDQFILKMLEDGIQCGLVTFNHIAKLVKPLEFFSTAEKREEHAKAVRGLVADGGTLIGEGLALAMRTLGIDPYDPRRDTSGYILLLTDGQDSSFNITAAVDVLGKNSIIVDTVTFGPQADKRLTQLSKVTNGYAFFSRFENSTNDFLEQLSVTVRARVESSQKPIDIFSAPIQNVFSIPIFIDSSVGKDTSFLLTTYRAADINSMDMRVESPSGKVYSKESQEYTKDTMLGTVTIKINGQIESGQWKVTDGSSANAKPFWSNAEVVNTRAALTVTSKPASKEEPVILDGSVISEAEISKLNRSTEVVIGASLMRGAQLLSGAKILAKVESESSVDAVLKMQDNGVYPDVEADDGIYSALVPLKNIAKAQEYSVRIICESPVDRVTSAGKFYVKSVDLSSLQNLPPSSVQDLKVAVNLASKTVRLTWTAVGDEQNLGTAAQYVIKSSRDATVIQDQFYLADNVSATVTPLPAGSTQSVNISSSQIQEYNGTTFYLAVQAVSSKSAASAVSNLVATQLTVPDNVEIIEGGFTTLIPEVPTTKAGAREAQICGVSIALILGFSLLTLRAALH